MNYRRWSDEDTAKALRLYEAGYPPLDIAQMLGRTESSVRLKLLGLGYSSRRIVRADSDPSSNRQSELYDAAPHAIIESEEAEIGFLARIDLDKRNRRKEEREKLDEAKSEIIADRIVQILAAELSTFPRQIFIAPPAPPSKDREPQDAVLVVSDMHSGQVVDPAELDGLSSYNPAIMASRLKHLELETCRILADRNLTSLQILFGGDMAHGHLGHSLEDDLTVPISTQVDLAVSLLFPFIASLAQVATKVHITGVAGNHGRWPGMRKMPSDRRWSNLDTIIYQSLATVCAHAGISNVSWDDRISSRRVVEVGKYLIQLMHGDEIRGGSFCTSGMGREVTNSTLRNLHAGRRPIDYFVMGDKHTPATLPYGKGNFITNGSFVGVDGFGMNFLPAPPSQTLFFLGARGRSESHEIRLDADPLPSPFAYELKPTLNSLIASYTATTNPTPTPIR
jgi:hypothetical protein